MTANAPLLVIHPLFGDQQNGSHGHQHAADHIEKGSADAAGGWAAVFRLCSKP